MIYRIYIIWYGSIWWYVNDINWTWFCYHMIHMNHMIMILMISWWWYEMIEDMMIWYEYGPVWYVSIYAACTVCMWCDAYIINCIRIMWILCAIRQAPVDFFLRGKAGGEVFGLETLGKLFQHTIDSICSMVRNCLGCLLMICSYRFFLDLYLVNQGSCLFRSFRSDQCETYCLQSFVIFTVIHSFFYSVRCYHSSTVLLLRARHCKQTDL